MQRVINNCKDLRILSLPTEDNTEYNLPEDLCLYEETDLINIWNMKKQVNKCNIYHYYYYYFFHEFILLTLYYIIIYYKSYHTIDIMLI